MDNNFLIYYLLYVCIGFMLSVILMPFHEKISGEHFNRHDDREYKAVLFVVMFSFMWGVYLIISLYVLIKNYSKSWKNFLNKERL